MFPLPIDVHVELRQLDHTAAAAATWRRAQILVDLEPDLRQTSLIRSGQSVERATGIEPV